MKNSLLILISLAFLFSSSAILAQNPKDKKEETRTEETLQKAGGGSGGSGLYQMDVQGSNTATDTPLNAEVNYIGNNNIIAVRGYSLPSADVWGTGGYFTGGWFGVRGEVPSNSIGNFSSYAVYGQNNNTGTGAKYGIRGLVSTAAVGIHYGVYGSATGGTGSTLWAGYFDGNVNVTADVTAANFIGDGSQLTNLPGGTGGCNEYGDGSAGDLTISGTVDWSSTPPANRNFMFRNLTISNGAILTVTSGTKIQVSQAFDNQGTIVVKRGIPGERNFNNPNGNFPISKGSTVTPLNAYDIEQLRFISTSSLLVGGSNGGMGSVGGDPNAEGGAGGGVLIVRASTITNSGTIEANGGDGATPQAATDLNGAGGGGGGFVILIANTITNNGTIAALGGNGSSASGSTDYNGGGGGGGFIHLISSNATSVGGTLSVTAGTKGTGPTGTSGTTGGNGGASAGDGGLGGYDDFLSSQFISAMNGNDGIVITTEVPTPCNFSN